MQKLFVLKCIVNRFVYFYLFFRHRSDMYYTHLQHTEIPLKIHLTKSTEFKHLPDDQVMCYLMNSKPRGLVLIINNISFEGTHSDRSAAEHDENNLKDLFVKMGFQVDIFSNLTRAVSSLIFQIKCIRQKTWLKLLLKTYV